MELLERDEELAALTAATEDLARVGGRVVMLPGEPGIGKSALVDAFIEGLADRLSVWHGRCDNLVAAQPMGALHEAARSARPADQGVVAALQAGDVPDTMVRIREALASCSASVFVVDDLQWADDATLDILSHLVHRVQDLAVLFVLAYRPEAVTGHERLRRFLGSMPPRTAMLTLRPLTRDAIRELAPSRDVDRLCEVTGGNPFFVTEVLASGSVEVPPTVASAVLARLDSLPSACRAALERLSVWPGEMSFDIAERLVGDLDVLAEAELRGLLLVTEGGLCFRHEIARLATEATLPRVRRRRVDADVVEALRDRSDADLPRLVHHALSCGDADSVVAYAPRAADYCVRVGAHRQALSLYAAVLRFEDRLPRDQLAAACDAYAWELYNAHRFTEAVEYAERALRLVDREAPSTRIGPLGRAALQVFMSGAGDKATEYATLAVQLATDTDRRSHADALTSLGTMHALTGDHAEAIRQLDLVDVAPEEHADLRSLTLNYQAQCRDDLTEDERIDVVRQALQIALEHAAHEPIARAHTSLAELLYRFGRYDELAAALEEGLAFVREHGFWCHAYALESHSGLLSWRRGDVAAARHELEVLVGRYEDPGMLSLFSAVPLARLRARGGDRGAGEQLRSGWAFARRLGHLGGLGYAGAALAEWGWLYREPRTVEAVLRDWAPHASRPTAAAFDDEIRRYAALAGIETPGGAGGTPWGVALRGDHRGAAARWRSVGDPYELAIELAHGDAVDLQQAARLFDEHGAGPAGRWVRERLARMGRRPATRAPQRPSRSPVLTAREADVAELVARGMTNAEIADALFISARTVDHHVSAVLGKLGVDSRRAVATRLRQDEVATVREIGGVVSASRASTRPAVGATA